MLGPKLSVDTKKIPKLTAVVFSVKLCCVPHFNFQPCNRCLTMELEEEMLKNPVYYNGCIGYV